METGYGYSYALTQVGGVMDLPVMIYSNRPVVVTATQINICGGVSNLVSVGGRVVTQITGDSVDGTNIHYPGT